MTPSFQVPAQYFYALTANLPTDVDVDIRYRMVVTTASKRVVDDLHKAIDGGVISTSGLITPEQAARRLAALGAAQGRAPVCNGGVGSALVTAWLAYTNPTPTDDPVADIQPFWDAVLAPAANMTLTNPTLADGHLQLIVCALIQAGDPTALLAAVRASHTLRSVKDLDPAPWGGGAGLTYEDWRAIFQASPGAIPAFAQIGTAPLPAGLAEQTSAFVRRVAQFFNVPTLAPTTPTPMAGDLPQLTLPLFDPMGDPISGFLSAYRALGHPGYSFGDSLTLDDTTTGPQAAATVFPTDAAAAAWLLQAADAINAVYAVTKIAGVNDELRFSLAESLYARGLTSAAQIAELTQDELARTLIGTPAYPYAATIATNAGGPASPAPPPAGPFGPINDGTLANCVPPPWLSPLGPVAYLRELWLLPESATCALPAGDPNAPKPTLGDAVGARRGPLGQLLATRANLETGLPRIDLVNECLEALVADGAVDVVNQTAGDTLAGHPLAPPHARPDPDATPYRHDPEVLFGAMPEHSSPQAGLAGAYAKLRADFTACVLPYAQSLDVNRSYLRMLGTSRFATMRRFRKDISEFVFDPDPAHLPADFATYRWRYPVRVEIARELLGLSPEEHAQLFTTDIGPGLLAQLYGFPPGAPPSWMTTVATLSEFLKRTCLSYCELVALWQSGFVSFKDKVTGKEGDAGDFPSCEPCYLDKHVIVFSGSPAEALTRLAVFIRLWRKLEHVERGGYTFAQLADIATVLQLFTTGASINPDFIRQLAAFQTLRIDFDLPLVDRNAGVTPGATGADRTHLLALFVGSSSAEWPWALRELVEGVQRHAHREHGGARRPSELIKLLVANLDPLSRLAGFDPSNPTQMWNAHPTYALRFAEVLAKICASPFTVGELLYLFTVDDALDGDDPFPLPTAEESTDSPLDLPDDAGEHSLARLRQKLLEVDVSEEDARGWTWSRIATSLDEDFGFAPPPGGTDPVLALGRHFFPSALAHGGTTVTPHDRQYRTPLLASATSPVMWNNPDDGPFHFDAGSNELWVELPLRDEAVFEKLARIRPLTPAEQNAVQQLYFAPRLDLAPFAFLFSTFDAADRHLIQEGDADERWTRFRHAFARAHARCRIVAEHLTAHVAAVTGDHEHRDPHLALRLLRQLAADENAPVPPAQWESDSGKPPALTWALPTGGGFAALLGLLGTGLLGELRLEGSNAVVWRELRGPMDPFGRARDEWNIPAPMVIPSLGATLAAPQAGLASVRNGIAVTNADGRPLGGVQGHCVRWHGVLLVDRSGPHEFFAGPHAPGSARPNAEHARGRCWRVTLRRGQKTWIVLTRDMTGDEGRGDRSSPLPLKRGAYEITVELERAAPSWDDADDVRALRTGLELKYVGPDTDGRIVPVPLHRLFVQSKERRLGDGLDERVPQPAKQLLDALYTSTLRDVRRTYQRAFKSLLWARRFDLGAKSFADWGQSEVGHLLDHPETFMGVSFYGGAPWTTHRAYLDLDFLPVRDPYDPPAGDDRAHPSPRRQQALFDQWERVFDYTRLRASVRRTTEQPVWLLFDDAIDSPGEDPRQLLRHLGINATYAPLALTYDSGYSVAAADLVDERWPARAFRARVWLERIEREFLVKDVLSARPDLWASDDPGASNGNDDLMALVRDSLIEQGAPRRYEDLKRVDDGLRERARRALVAYLCGPSGGAAASPKELTEKVLLDVEAGLAERASRIEDAVTAVQTFVERARMGLEPSWSPSPGFLLLWETTYKTFHVWQRCKSRQAYRENWIECHEREEASRTEGFRFLEAELRRATLTVPAPGGLTWWDGPRPPEHPTLELLQAREPSSMVLIDDQPEALNLRGEPEQSAQRSWLAPIAGLAAPPPPPNDDGDRPPTDVPRVAAPKVTTVTAAARTPTSATGQLPLWIEAAIRLGVRFLRVAAAGVPPASNPFAPRPSAGRAPCCHVCGRRHDAVVDEYYFWLEPGSHSAIDGLDASGNNPALQDANANWNDDPGTGNGDLPKLLAWAPQPSVYLAWARMHDGELQQPRRSTHALPVTPGATLTLQLDGRKQDSLYFTVLGAAAPPPGYAATPDPGFRYDLATDAAIVVPQVAPDPTTINVPVPGVTAYPYFAYFAPGAPLAPLSMFSESVAVACTLRSHCRFEAALDWYEAYCDPLTRDLRWCWQSVPPPTRDAAPSANVREAVREGGQCCRYSTVTDDVARERAIVLDYLETLVEWGDADMRGNAPEAFQMARLRFDTAAKILGPTPVTVLDWDDVPTPPPTVLGLNPLLYGPPLNPRLLALYDRVADRRALIHHDESSRRLRNARRRGGMAYWQNDRPFERGEREGAGGCCETCGCKECRCEGESDWCCLPSPYRFTFLAQKALELANEVRAFGGALQSAFEKGDTEALTYVRAIHERQLTERALSIREDGWRAADWDVQSLEKAREAAQNQLQYYSALIAGGLDGGELDYQSLENGAIGSYGAAIVTQTIATVLGPIPDLFVGENNFTWLALGTKLAGVFTGISQISSLSAQIQSTNAQLRLTQAGWDRRLTEWQHQVDQYTIQIEQITRQLLAAQRRRDSALHDLNNTRLQIAQSREVLDFLRDKFTSHAFYLHLQKETAALHREMFDLALHGARHAERAFNFERGYTARRFIDCEPWRDLREGLLSGERLVLALRRMETCYADENVRTYELTKHISLRQLFPHELLLLKLTGRCELDLPEWLFDLDYPGQYMRRIKSVALTIPCVAGPYTGVHCRLTLLASETRIAPWLVEPVAPCCKPPPPPKPPAEPPCGCWSPTPPPEATEEHHRAFGHEHEHRRLHGGYLARPEDPRVVRRHLAKEAIATSSGQNDAGLFELNFRDERYLPFEFEGAVSRWRLELPAENNDFDMDTLSDVVLHLNYTSREGGEVLRRAAREATQSHLPDDGRRLVDVRQELADEWRRFHSLSPEERHRRLELPLGRDTFLFLPGHRDVWIHRVEVFFLAPDADPGDHHTIAFVPGHKRECARAHDDARDANAMEFPCVVGRAWPGWYHGAVDLRLGPLSRREHDRVGALRFGRAAGRVERVLVVFGYEAHARTRGERAQGVLAFSR